MEDMKIIKEQHGVTTRYRQLCTSPIHFRNILLDWLTRYSSEASYNFVYGKVIPLQNVGAELERFERLCRNQGQPMFIGRLY